MRCLVVGLGGIGQRHVRNLRTLCGDDVDIIAYRVRRDTPLLTDTLKVDDKDTVEKRYKIRSFYKLDEALAQKPDFALICNPSSLHVPLALKLAEANCHLMIEKPLSDHLEGIDQLIVACEQRKLAVLAAYQWRFHPLIKKVHQLLQEGALGQLVSVHAEIGEYLPGWHTYEDYRRTYAARKDQGGGVILSQIHEMDYLSWLFGTPSRVVAFGGTRSRLGIDVEDTAAILMDVDGLPIAVHEDYLQRPARRALRIVGDTGLIVADLQAPHLAVYKEGQLVEEQRFEGFVRNQLFLDEMRHFLDCVAGKAQPVVPLRSGLNSLRMALAARQSIETGEIVRL
jgi:predicted dehydrogenase